MGSREARRIFGLKKRSSKLERNIENLLSVVERKIEKIEPTPKSKQ